MLGVSWIQKMKQSVYVLKSLVGKKKKNKTVVSESETIQHIASISARAVHGRHAGSKLTACIL
jgi:hypothetical protein